MTLNRSHTLNTHPLGPGPIIFWFDRDLRAEDNWALLQAAELANKQSVPLIAVYNLVPNFLGGGERQLHFKISILEELEKKLAHHHIPLFVITDETGHESADLLLDFFNDHHAGAVVTDFSPLKIQRAWKNKVAKKLPVTLIEVDTHNIVPVWIASPKQEYGAYTLRPKLHRLLPEYLTEFPPLPKVTHPYSGKKPSNSWLKLKPSTAFTKPDAHKTLTHFLHSGLELYKDHRNDPLADAQSNLSPYLHYGVISAQRIALTLCTQAKQSITKILPQENNAAVFLEELIVRRELADNYCFYNVNYDNPDGFPDWAQKNLTAHASDAREYVYTKKQFEEAKTHDPLWNAAQREMVQTGKMHGYLRMYWAKKILEWTPNVADAQKIAIYLNDKYELDGRDPNGYTGIAWSMGGVHDRTWFKRPIFGTIRYMARSGCDKKFNTKAYIAKYS